jgi:hypothetical protein
MEIDTLAAERALGWIAHDIRTTTHLRDELHLEVGPHTLGFSAQRGERTVAGWTEPLDPAAAGSLPGLIVHLANLLRHHYVMEALSRAWPRCPAHDHVLEPSVKAKRAVWSCPQNAIHPIEIGRLRGG